MIIFFLLKSLKYNGQLLSQTFTTIRVMWFTVPVFAIPTIAIVIMGRQ